MTNNELDITLGFCAATIGILAFTNEFPNKSYLKFVKSLAFKLIVFVLATIIGVWATVEKNFIADNEKTTEKLNSQKEQRKNDSANRKLTDQSNAKLVSAFTNALAKYNLKYDSAQKVVLKQVRDSARKVITITREEEPNLVLSAIVLKNIENGTYHFNITIVSQKAESEHIFVKLFICSEEDDGYHLMNGITDFYAKDGTLGTGEQFSFNIDLKDTNQLKSFNFLLLGKYKSVNGQTIIVNRIYSYDLSLKNIGIPLEPYYSKIKLFFQQNGIKN